MEVNGGAESYCRQLAEKLTEFYDVSVYTTCAIDYKSWKNEYPAGVQEINGVHVKRFPSERSRKKLPFAVFSKFVMHIPFHIKYFEEKWIDAQGPYCPLLIETLKKEQYEYQTVLFMTYLYYPTVRGILLCSGKAILIPTVHDEKPVYMHCYNQIFSSPKAIAWNTPEEMSFAYKRFPNIKNIPCEITGIGIDVPKEPLPNIPELLQTKRYILYVGRIDRSKGCNEMFKFFSHYKQVYGGDLKLVLLGKPVMKIPNHPDIIHLGFVSEKIKYSIIRHAVALVLFSKYESLSMVVLESMAMGRPVLVTGRSEVLKGHCERSKAGLYFYTETDFYEKLKIIEKSGLDEKGIEYVQNNYTWDTVINKYLKLINKIPNRCTIAAYR